MAQTLTSIRAISSEIDLLYHVLADDISDLEKIGGSRAEAAIGVKRKAAKALADVQSELCKLENDTRGWSAEMIGDKG